MNSDLNSDSITRSSSAGYGLFLPRMQPWALIRTSWKTDENFPKFPALTRKNEEKFLKRCTPRAAHQSKNRGFQEGQEPKFQQRVCGQVLPALFRRTPGLCRRDYSTSAKHEVLQGVEDPRGPVGIHATRKGGLRWSQPPLGVLTK
jgi:hypothetical protein